MALTVIKPSGLDLSGNFSVTTLNASANLTAGNVLTDNLKYANGSPYVFGSGNAAGSNTQIQFNDANSFAGSANLTFDKTTNTLSVTNIVANGSGLTNLTGANVTGEVGLATFATTANAVAGANVSGVVANATYAVTAGSTEQSNIANIAYSVSASNISGIINLANFATTANAVAGANVSGQVGNALVSGTVYTNAQPNITSVGTLISLDVTGNAQFSGANVSLGSVGNLKITGGTANYVLQTDGTGNLSWAEQSGSPGSTATATTDSFTGNGVATSFTLSVTPTNKDWTVVNYNGVLVLRSDYTLAGNVITFTNAPANSAEIEVTSISLSAGGGGGSTAASVGYSLIFGV